MGRKATLFSYVRRRTGVPLGGRGSLVNMLSRSLGASSFAGFWRHWNPMWGYGLSRYVFSPLRRRLPAPVALILTFLASGLIHDAVIIAVRGELAFVFAPWFLFLALGLLLGEATGLNFGRWVWPARAAIVLLYIAAALALSLVLTESLGLWWPASAHRA